MQNILDKKSKIILSSLILILSIILLFFVLNRLYINEILFYKTNSFIDEFMYLAGLLVLIFSVIVFGFILKNKSISAYCILLLIVYTLFLFLYAEYVFGEALLVYTDVGSDTFYGYTPNYINLLGQLKKGDFSSLTLYSGIGNYNFKSSNSALDFPFFLILLFFDKTQIYDGLLLATLLKYIIIAVFSYKLFINRSTSKKVALICSLLWTFNGWFVLWGQHYWFLTIGVYFTIIMYIVDKSVNTDSTRLWIVYGICIGILSSFNYYMCYLCCASAGVYILYLTVVENKAKFSKNLKKYLISTFCSLVIFLPLSFKWLSTVFGSARTVTFKKIDLLRFDLENITLRVGRLFSPDLFGTTEYYGLNNLYEDSILNITIFFLIAIILWNKNNKKRLIFSIVLILSIFTDISNIVLNIFNNTRWYLLFIFFEIIIICDVIKELLDENYKVGFKKNIIIIVSFCVTLIVLFVGDKCTIINIVNDDVLVKKIVLFVALYVLVNFDKKSKITLLGLLFVAEIIISNYNILNERGYIKKEELSSYINSDIQTVVEDIQLKDESLYRFNNMIARSILSDGSLYGYYGTNSYSSLNSAHYMEFINSLNETGSAHSISLNVNHADIECDNYAVKTLLGVKYIITNSNYLNNGELINTSNDVNVFLNKNYLPMGYCYNTIISKDEYLELSTLEKNLYLFDGCYSDDKRLINAEYEELNIEEIKFRYMKYPGQGENGLKVDIFPYENSTSYEGLSINFNLVSPKTGAYALIKYNDGDIKKEVYVYLINGEREYSVFLEGTEINNIILQVRSKEQVEEYSITYISIKQWAISYNNLLDQKISRLKETCGDNISYSNDIYRATIFCEGETVYCVPIIYSKNWTAYVNGEKKEVLQISDTMCGIPLSSGENEIRMEYSYPIYKYTIIASVICLIYVIVFFLKQDIFMCKKRKTIKQ